MSDTRESLLQAIEADRDRLIDFFSRFVQAKSPNPPGDTREAVGFIRGFLEQEALPHGLIAPQPSMATTAAQVARVGRRHDRSFRARFPMLEGVDMEYRWGGHLCLSWNSVPAFGGVEAGVYTACCQHGLGTVKGTLAGSWSPIWRPARTARSCTTCWRSSRCRSSTRTHS